VRLLMQELQIGGTSGNSVNLPHPAHPDS
jgi:hypothetical protein